MPLLLHQHINLNTTLALWKIEEDEEFFLQTVKLQQPVHHPHKRLQHLAGRYLLSVLVPSFPYDEMIIPDRKKPFLLLNQYQFSISHCGDYAAVIISTKERVGIDIEMFSSKTELVKHKYLDKDELSSVHSLQERYPELFRHHRLYTLCWCAKEAAYKWWGEGDIDFKKNIRIRAINMEDKMVSVLFEKGQTQAELMLPFLLLPSLSVVWTATSL